ncbi:MAG: hypothetical protein AAGC65_11815 [Mucilaginibacter sp.]|uniref:hypothetical protein n=1 Tax=Mucilaginibacter sp. TaxID=1882438 RepID=UPI0031A42331
MIASRRYIIYSLPKSRTTQSLPGKKIEKVWNNIQLFLETCTTANIENPTTISLHAFSADEDHGESPELAQEVLEYTKSNFGAGATSSIGNLYPQNIPLKQTVTDWDLDTGDLKKAVDFMIKGQPWPKYNLGPVELILSYDFKLIDMASNTELPNQQFTSSVLIWLSRRNCVIPSLCLPFEEPNEKFWNYIDSIEPFLPFKLERKYLRLGKSNKKGTSNMFSKL